MEDQSPRIPLKQKLLVSASIVFVSIVLDQLTKLAAWTGLRGQPGHSFLGGIVRLEYAENTGAFLSLGANMGETARLLILVFGVMIVIGFCVAWLIRSTHSWLGVVALSLVISGGLGNLIDRIWRGSVVDFLIMGVGPVRTGVFNVADMAITGGLLLMLYDQYVVERAKDQVESRG